LPSLATNSQLGHREAPTLPSLATRRQRGHLGPPTWPSLATRRQRGTLVAWHNNSGHPKLDPWGAL
jgi:hypothetical protein